MPGAVVATAGPAVEIAEIASRAANASRDRATEVARAQVDKTVATTLRPRAATQLDTAQAVETLSRSTSVAARRPALSPDIRSMMMGRSEPPAPSQRGASSSTQLVAQLVDALRAYEKQYG